MRMKRPQALHLGLAAQANQGLGEDTALPTSGPAAFSKHRAAFFGGKNFCLFLAPSEVQSFGCWETSDWVTVEGKERPGLLLEEG